MEEQLHTSAPLQNSGYVYVLSNQSMPGVVKIGLTTGDVNKRAAELQGTGLPTPFEIELALHVPNCRKLEKDAHQELRDLRIEKNREFFKISPEEARVLLFQLVDGEFTNNELFDALYEVELQDMTAEFDLREVKNRKRFNEYLAKRQFVFFGVGLVAGVIVSFLIALTGKL